MIPDRWYYIQSCELLLLPILLWNFLFTGYLPPALATDEFWRDIPSFIVHGENTLRTADPVLDRFVSAPNKYTSHLPVPSSFWLGTPSPVNAARLSHTNRMAMLGFARLPSNQST
jgi:hypothetical protein